MKFIAAFAIATLAVTAANPAFAENEASKNEINYPKGALAFDSIISGQYREAASSLEASAKVDANDPARQINLGYAYAKLGRTADARMMLTAAATNRRSFDLILADGRIINSRAAAKLALGRLESNYAAR